MTTLPKTYLATCCALLLLVVGICGTHHLFFTSADAARMEQKPGPPSLGVSLGEAVQATRYQMRTVTEAGRKTALATNPAQRLRASFTAEQVQFQPTSDSQQPWQLGFKLKGYGYGKAWQEIPAGEVSTHGNRVEIKRAAVTEWYTNTPKGIEQGFTLRERPTNATATPLRLVLEVQGAWQAKADANGQSLTLQNRSTSLRYDQLHTFDATGRELPSRMEVNGNELALVVNDAEAVWPLTIDPTLSQQTQLVASNGGAADQLGYAVAISGDTAIVGVPDNDFSPTFNQGAAYVFVRSNNTWSQQAQLIANDAANNDAFGWSVAISGDTAVVGAYNDDIGSNGDQGSAYVFVRSGSTWSQQAKLTASDGATNDWFGYSVAASGEMVVVGVPLNDGNSITNSGAAYVFVRSGTAWTQETQLRASDANNNYNFGFAVALNGSTAVIGSPASTVNGNPAQGSAYVFVRSGTTWSQQQQLTASNGATNDQFGYSVALSNDTALIGAPMDEVMSNSERGSAYVFVRSGSAWSQQQQLTASNGASGDQFGYSVGVSNDMAVVGAPTDDVGANTDQGSAYVFTRSSSAWSQQQQLTASSGAAYDDLGTATAINGYTIVVGAPQSDQASNADQGAAYIFSPTCPSITLTPTTVPGGTQNLAYSSTAIAPSAGTAPFTYEIISGALPSGLTLSSAGVLAGTPSVAGNFNFTVKITDTNLCVGTRAYSLSIASCAPPTMTTQPTNQSALVAGSASFTAVAGGTPPSVQWQVSTDSGNNWANLEGATNTTLSLSNVTITMNGNQYRAVFTNACGTVTSNAATLTVGKLTPTVTLNSSAATTTYGQSVTFTATVSGAVSTSGTVIFKDGAATLGTGMLSSGQATVTTSTLAAGNHSLTVEYGGDTNYFSGTSSALSQTINQATLTVTADNKARSYGAANPDLTATITGYVNNETSSVISGSAALTTIANATSNVGNHTITAAQGTLTAANYNFTFVAGTLAISKVTLTVTADNKTKVFGAALPDFTYSVTGFRNDETTQVLTGAPSLTTAASGSSNAGQYPINISIGTLAATNYDFTLVNGTLNIGQATLTVTAENKTRTYGTANPSFTVQYSGFVNNDNESVLSGAPDVTTAATPGSTVGTQPITVAQGTLAATNYQFVFAPGTLTITKATLTVQASDAARSYGAANPTLTGTLTGVQNNDNLTASYTTAATNTSAVGTYAITPALNDPDSKAGNYNVTLTNGTLTVNKATLTVTADNKTKTYGTTNPELTATITGFANNETSSVLSGSAALNTAATATSNAGTYAITAASGTLAATNYNFTFSPGTLTINKATLTVTADNKSRTYGAANPTLTATITGFVNGENSSVVSGDAALSTTATNNSPASTYTITAAPGTLAATNYDFTFVNGTLTVGKATLTVVADNKAKVFGEALPNLTYSFNGFLNGDSASAVNGAPSLTTNATSISNAGSYPITLTAGSLAATSYDFVFTNGTLTINAANTALTLVSDVPSALLGQEVTLTALINAVAPGAGTPTGTITFKNGTTTLGTASLTNGQARFTTNQLAIGSHSLTAVFTGTSNFNTSTSAVLSQTVSKAAATVTVASSLDTAAYGQAVSLNVTVGGAGATPTGTLRFLDGGTPLGTATLSNGRASFTVQALSVGTHSITVVYDGDAQNQGGTSRAFSLTINKARPAFNVGSSVNPAAWKQFLTLSVNLGNATPGIAAPTGSITFKDGSTVLGTVALDRRGRANLDTNKLTGGAHTITADFGGDGNYEANASASLPLTINKGATTMRLVSSTKNATSGQQVLLYASVYSTGDTPTGQVEFFSGNQSLGEATLSGGVAVLATTALPVGDNSITASYKGDNNSAPSQSAPLKQAISAFCTWKLSATSAVFTQQGGVGIITVETLTDCYWYAYTTNNWITITDYGPEVGAVSFTVAPLTNGTSRTGTIHVADKTVTVVQTKGATSVSGASFQSGGIAPNSIVSVFGEAMAAATEAAQTLPLPTTLAQTKVKITDANGTAHFAPLFYVSPLQINYQVPAEAALGPALVTIEDASGNVTSGGMIEISVVSPAVFSANSSGKDLAAANIQRVRVDGSQSFEGIATWDAGQGKIVPVPIDMGEEGEELYLVLYGTGIRSRIDLISVRATVNNEDTEVLYADTQGYFVGVDQINLKLSRQLAGKGTVDVKLLVEGKVVNTVQIHLK